MTFSFPKRGKFLLFLVLIILLALDGPIGRVHAQTDEITWSNPINISNTPDETSTDPFLLADPSGIVHLFWAEKKGIAPTNQPDTIFYTQFDGQTWSTPVDIVFSPLSDGNPIASIPHAVLDDSGRIHLIWLSQPNFPYYTLNYSSVNAVQAMNVQAWQPKTVLATDLTGTKYSIHIAYAHPETLHVIFARGAQGDLPKEDRSVGYMRSTDGGLTWSDVVSLFTVPVMQWGTSDTRLLFEPPGNIYASWTMWEETGIGRDIFFTRSLDNGLTWDDPVSLTQRADEEYERDWNNLALLGPNHIMAMWEGGYRAYRYSMYSSDAGKTWSRPIDTFPGLIGENGYAEFASDSTGRLHLFFSQRIREGTQRSESSSSRQVVEGLWHSSLETESRWVEPALANGINPMVNPKAVIYRGNRVMAAWYSSLTLEIIVMSGLIETAPETPTKPWPPIIPTQAPPTKVVPTAPLPTEIPATATPISFAGMPQERVSNEWGQMFLVAVLPSAFISILLMLYILLKSRKP